MDKKIPLIVEKNKDVEHIMLASCQYGYYGLGVANATKLFTMLVTTDVHGCQKQLNSAIDYLNYYEAIDCGITLGDMQPANFSESDGTWYVEPVLRSEKDFYTVLGNHDNGNSANVRISATPQMAFEKFIRPTKEKIGIDGLDKPYYLKLIDKYKIALIVLDNYDAPDTLNEEGNYAVCRSKDIFSQAQADWFVSALNSIPKEYHLIIAQHCYPYSAITEVGAWSQENITYDAKNPYGNNDMISDILNAWIHGAALEAEYAPIAQKEILPTLQVKCDFTARGEGIFVCYLTGHHHYDAIAKSEKYPNQKVISLASTANDLWQNHCSDLPRALGTKAEDLFTVFSVHTQKRQIRLVRIGSNFTMDMQERTYKVMEY